MSYSATLKAIAGAHTGIAPVNLLDVEDTNDNLHYWGDRAIDVPVVLTGEVNATTDAKVSVPAGQKVAWCYPSTVTPTIVGDASCYSKINDTHLMATTGVCDVESVVVASGGETTMSGYTAWCKVEWSQFSAKNIPSGAQIQKVEAVVLVDYSITDGSTGGQQSDFSELFYGSGNGQLSKSLGSNLGVVGQATVAIGVQYNNRHVYENAYIKCSFCALAVYYTAADSLSDTVSYPGTAAYGSGPYIPWLLSVPQFSFHRSLATDTGEFLLQNLSGDTLSRDFEKIVRRSTLEGAMFVYRLWHVEAEEALLEVHGTLSVSDIGRDTVKLTACPLINAASIDCPLENYCETCQLDWGGVRCGSTESTECHYSFQTCQVPRRFMGVLNHFEKNYGTTEANTASNVINRRRRI
jgi:hypothetical protein